MKLRDLHYCALGGVRQTGDSIRAGQMGEIVEIGATVVRDNNIRMMTYAAIRRLRTWLLQQVIGLVAPNESRPLKNTRRDHECKYPLAASTVRATRRPLALRLSGR